MKYPLMRNNILAEDLRPVIDLLSTQDPRLTSGPKVEEFENKWSEWLGVKYSLFVNSGSSSNLLAVALLKERFPEGGKIIVPAFTWSSDISSVFWMGFEPLFVDISLDTLGLDGKQVIENLEKYNDVRAVFLTHAQGINGLDEKLSRYLDSHEIYLIEDVCESHGTKLKDGRKAGSRGHTSCFSFYYAHHMSTIEGGMVCTNDLDSYEALRMLRSHGMSREAKLESTKDFWSRNYPDLNPQFIFTRPAFNVRNTEIGAIIGLQQLKRLDSAIKKRAFNFNKFLDLIPDVFFKDFQLDGQSNYAFNLILREPDPELMIRLEEGLTASEIEYRKGSAGGGNQMRQPYVKDMFSFSDDFISRVTPITDHIHKYGLYIGNFPDLKESEIEWLSSVLHSLI